MEEFLYQCPLGLVLHFYFVSSANKTGPIMVSMPFRANAPFLRDLTVLYALDDYVSMPFRANAPFLHTVLYAFGDYVVAVSMPFRANAPFLRRCTIPGCGSTFYVSMPFRANAPFLLHIIFSYVDSPFCINALSG